MFFLCSFTQTLAQELFSSALFRQQGQSLQTAICMAPVPWGLFVLTCH